MLDIKLLVWVVAVYSLPLHCTGRCLFGNSDECVFKCHCDKVKECNDPEVTCPGGCASDILGYKWRGSACQIGNLSYRKSAKFHGQTTAVTGDASKAVDGKPEPSCTQVAFSRGTLAQWSVDLGHQYKIININIQFPNLNCCGLEKSRNHFLVSVTTTDQEGDPDVVCIKENSDIIPPVKYTINCPDNTTGRYVYFSRLTEGFEPHHIALCEMVVIGYKPLDCSSCPAGVTCNDVIGCKRCLGSYRPDCKQDCDDSYYGTNCQQKCGKCRNVTVCNKISGACPSGCQQWWASDFCHTYIERPQTTNKSISILTSDDTSLTLEWVQIIVAKDIVMFYGYKIKYKRSDDTNFVKEVIVVRQQLGSSINKVTIRDLVANTWYDVIINPYREWKGNKDYGLPYDTVKGRTRCTNPDNPKLTSVLRVPIIVDKTDKVDVIFEDLQKLYSGCDTLSKAWLHYKRQDYNNEQRMKLNVTSRASSFKPQYGGTYFVWLTVENNDGLKASSDIWNVTVNGPISPSETRQSTSNMTIIIVSVVGVICLIVVIVTVVCCVRRRQNKPFKERINEDPNQKDENDDLEEEMIDVKGRVVSTLPQLPPRSKKLSSAGETGTSNGVYQNFELELIQDVNMEDFEDYVNRRMDTDQFVEEYASLPPADQDRCVIAMSEANIKCNRYRKIYPYDDTLVALRKDDGLMEGDFINASYITGYGNPREYIATQG